MKSQTLNNAINLGSVDRKTGCWDVVIEIKCKLIRWPGHILPKVALRWTSTDNRKNGRP